MWITRNGGVTKFDPADSGRNGSLQNRRTEMSATSRSSPGRKAISGSATDERPRPIPPADPEKPKTSPSPAWHRKTSTSPARCSRSPAQEKVATFDTGGPAGDTTTKSKAARRGWPGSPSGQIAFTAPLATPEQVGPDNAAEPAADLELLGDPFGVAFGPDGAFWIAQAGPPGSSPVSPPTGRSRLSADSPKVPSATDHRRSREHRSG